LELLWSTLGIEDWRPQRYINAAATISTAAPPIAIPAIAPGDREDFESDVFAEGDVGLVDAEVVDVCVLDAVEDVGVAAEDVDELLDTCSEGKYSPGLNINVEFIAYASWVLKVSVELALITPIIPYSIQASGAEQ
jgi:hypothetical protein